MKYQCVTDQNSVAQALAAGLLTSVKSYFEGDGGSLMKSFT